tara:strand:+ start:173 stop:313 length:141 start_codon:yes stop_codon:yes gene_type:complete
MEGQIMQKREKLVLAIYNYMREQRQGFTLGEAELLFRKLFEGTNNE